MIRSISILLFLTLASCTNYSSQKQLVNPPILTAIAVEGTGHVITMTAQNVEIGFSGYRLYQGTSDSAVRGADPLAGIDCSRPLAVATNAGVAYQVEVKAGQSAISPGFPNRVCVVPLQLTSGTYIAMRSLILRDFLSLDTSISSNSLLVP
ncbi:MAG: hypothetical protein JNM27_14625 [Leptospirales bacterium]|nr:hypothetical protein [Leptospirales bacterium]